MLYFILSCLFLVAIVLWWAEAKYNFIYRKIISLKNLCVWIKKQTKLKIDICKWLLPCIFIIGAVNTLYYPYFKQTLDFTQGTFVIKNYAAGSKGKELVSKQTTENIEKEEKTNPIGDWGTFGDFIGGTLNPIIGFISILLLFATWKLTSSTFKSTDSALKSQQFDSWFFNLLQSFQSISNEYSKKNEEISFYKQLFLDKKQNLALSQDILLVQYFSSLKILLKMIDTKLNFIENEKDQEELKDFYVDIIISNISEEILQVLAWCAFQDKELKKLMEENGFFRTLNFNYIIDRGKHLFSDCNFEMLSNLHRYDEKIFKNSQQFLTLKETYIYEVFFSNDIFIDRFFKKQYKEELRFQLIGALTGNWNLSLKFEQNGLEIRSVGDSHLDPQTVNYNEMVFNTYNIKVDVKDFFELNIPSGQLHEMKIYSETAKLQNLEIR